MAVTTWGRPEVKNRSLSQFRSELNGGGARPNLFEVGLQWPAGIFPTSGGGAGFAPADRGSLAGGGVPAFLCKASQLPASINGVVEVPFRGRMLKIAGDRTFEPWSITVINETNMALRAAFERWVNWMAVADAGQGRANPNDYQVDLQVHQLGKANYDPTNDLAALQAQNIPALRTYKFYSCFPTSVSQIDLSFDANDTVEEFTVEFAVQYWEADGPGADASTLAVQI